MLFFSRIICISIRKTLQKCLNFLLEFWQLNHPPPPSRCFNKLVLKRKMLVLIQGFQKIIKIGFKGGPTIHVSN